MVDMSSNQQGCLPNVELPFSVVHVTSEVGLPMATKNLIDMRYSMLFLVPPCFLSSVPLSN